ncbi:flagellin [Pseudodesulfovibrio sp. zrk46]|uniref:flagellin n=1 Tax=Pseudodesulfovibrio sp. zrk46 TaxID=2725288 RepID=UPI001448D4AE|nr:flagellin [Pseudodesulfovibrio sp. zrk46]QJB57772.1 flagellin [Pseudodesulfovibrio sp. zrk46]
MALTDVEKNFIVNYSQQLLQQDLLTNQLFGASRVGQDLRSMVLGEAVKAKTFTNPFEQAISGSLRADADSTRQAGRNVGEAASMMGVAKNAMADIVDSLEAMEKIIEDIEAGDLDASSSVVQADYNALKDKITGTISSTDFNGIYMLDSSQWGTDQISAGGQVYIQSSTNGGFNISFHAVDAGSSSVNWSDLSGAALDGSLATQKSYVDNLKSFSSTVEDMYESKTDTLESQKIQLEGQAQLLDQAVQYRMPSSPDYSLEKLLADLIARNTGGVIDTNG